MRLRRFALVLLGILAAAMVAALPAAGKEGVKATLATSIPLDTLAGTPLKVAWTLAYIDDKGNRRLFGAAGVFVRLRSASGGQATTAFAPMDGGEYAATVVVPEGGIGDVQIGLRSWVSDANGTRTSDELFPITNDPLPGPGRVASHTSGQPVSAPISAGSTTWIVALVAGSSFIFALLAIALVRGRKVGGGARSEPDRRVSVGKVRERSL